MHQVWVWGIHRACANHCLVLRTRTHTNKHTYIHAQVRTHKHNKARERCMQLKIDSCWLNTLFCCTQVSADSCASYSHSCTRMYMLQQVVALDTLSCTVLWCVAVCGSVLQSFLTSKESRPWHQGWSSSVCVAKHGHHLCLSSSMCLIIYVSHHLCLSSSSSVCHHLCVAPRWSSRWSSSPSWILWACCSVLRCVVLQCVVACCSALGRTYCHHRRLQSCECVAVCCSVLQCVMLQCVVL